MNDDKDSCLFVVGLVGGSCVLGLAIVLAVLALIAFFQ